MTQGASSQESVKMEILKISSDGEKHGFSKYNKTCKCSRATLSKYLKELVKEKLLKKTPGQEKKSFHPRYQITPRGRECYIEKIGTEVRANCARLQDILENTFTSDALSRIRREATLTPTEEQFKAGYLDTATTTTMLEHKENVLAPLNNLFFELAKDLIKADSNAIGVREDLKNVEFYFKEGKPHWTIHPDKSYWSPENRL